MPRPQFLVDYFPWGYLDGVDNTGHVIEWVGLGNIDTKGMLLSCNMEELTRYKVRVCARRRGQSTQAHWWPQQLCYCDGCGACIRGLQLWRVEEVDQKARKTDSYQITVVTDMWNLSSRHLYRPGLQYFADTEKMVEDFYPELLYKVLIIRPPRIFNLLYNMVKHAFDPVTRAKFEVVAGEPLQRLCEVMSKVSRIRPRGGPGSAQVGSRNTHPIPPKGRGRARLADGAGHHPGQRGRPARVQRPLEAELWRPRARDVLQDQRRHLPEGDRRREQRPRASPGHRAGRELLGVGLFHRGPRRQLWRVPRAGGHGGPGARQARPARAAGPGELTHGQVH